MLVNLETIQQRKEIRPSKSMAQIMSVSSRVLALSRRVPKGVLPSRVTGRFGVGDITSTVSLETIPQQIERPLSKSMVRVMLVSSRVSRRLLREATILLPSRVMELFGDGGEMPSVLLAIIQRRKETPLSR